ncbi:hypothetical protein BLA60_17070 [Actinophytocola xinjiangensis]|uniref:Sortase family protein n=1 Tax=Actinophytocola xinjiangensis TaxID=485602 RepID=A0A7Z1AYB7_9PSEU|nr:hypothetical protein BLA60_17070 [Actinophytocola xinjiangensis]
MVLTVVASYSAVVAVGGAAPESVDGVPVSTTVLQIGDTVDLPAAPRQPLPTTATRPPPAPPSSSASPPPAPPPAPAQRAGTVRLAEGGTATLVPSEVRDGVLPVPDDLDEATWWGASPGAASGATVLAGHVNWNGAIGPFAELWRTNKGDPVTIVDRSGRTLRFQVTEVVTLDKDELPGRATDLFGQTGAHRLVLVTCGGRWVGGTSGYADNRIIIATRR